jgi:hypothetical protein
MTRGGNNEFVQWLGDWVARTHQHHAPLKRPPVDKATSDEEQRHSPGADMSTVVNKSGLKNRIPEREDPLSGGDPQNEPIRNPVTVCRDRPAV